MSRLSAVAGVAAVCTSMLFCSACDYGMGAGAGPEEAPVGLEVQTAPLATETAPQEVTGYATVLSPDQLIQADADLRNAKISADYSKAVFDRAERLMHSSVAISQQAYETAQRQADADAILLHVMERRLEATWGDQAPFLDAADRSKVVTELSSGRQVIIRADIVGERPELNEMKLSPLGGGQAVASTISWKAPTGNLAMPGMSYFVLAPAAPGLRAGDRAQFSSVTSAQNSGLLIPRAAVVLSGGEAWCFVEFAPKKYERRHVALTEPNSEGYLAKQGFTPGERVVVRGAAMLLANEASSAKAAN